MDNNNLIKKRFSELEYEAKNIRFYKKPNYTLVDKNDYYRWTTSALNLLSQTLGERSVHFNSLKQLYENFEGYQENFKEAFGVFLSAKEDYEGGYIFSLESVISGDIFGDFVNLAKTSLKEGYKDVAAVLACAALEDALKKFARKNNLNVDDKEMNEVVNALKSKGLVSGAQKTLLSTMPKIRNYAMHADWGKISPVEVNSVIGFVEQLLLQYFS